MASGERERQPATATPPHFTVPPGAADCHFHVYDFSPQYKWREGLAAFPPDTPVSALRAMHRIIGVKYGLFVHTGGPVYRDNSLLIDSLAADHDLRGIATVTEDIPNLDSVLAELRASAGMSGLRISLRQLTTASGGNKRLELLQSVAKTIADWGWHLQLHLPGKLLPDLAPLVASLAVPTIVIDHMGRITPEIGIDGPEFKALAGLIETGRVWVKLSAMFRNSRQGPPYDDLAPIGKAIVAVAKERTVFGTDWPFNHFDGAPPDSGTLLDCIAAWAPDAATRDRILVENPRKLYGFH